ncbi:unnamed protein product [Protopolystoma xenopodis]|uniref:Uncharacterized protein n=1 Tax=Protopolystoma xenopodis TaxID=117903 RepID=A0A3S5B0Y8_9PLAT|nr:unnamed protein product [Protopolystoma xenopodis]
MPTEADGPALVREQISPDFLPEIVPIPESTDGIRPGDINLPRLLLPPLSSSSAPIPLPTPLPSPARQNSSTTDNLKITVTSNLAANVSGKEGEKATEDDETAAKNKVLPFANQPRATAIASSLKPGQVTPPTSIASVTANGLSLTTLTPLLSPYRHRVAGAGASSTGETFPAGGRGLRPVPFDLTLSDRTSAASGTGPSDGRGDEVDEDDEEHLEELRGLLRSGPRRLEHTILDTHVSHYFCKKM